MSSILLAAFAALLFCLNRTTSEKLCRGIDDFTLHQRAWQLARMALLPPPKLPKNLTNFVGKQNYVFLQSDPFAVCNSTMEMLVDPALDPPVMIVTKCRKFGHVNELGVLHRNLSDKDLPRGTRALKCSQVNKTVLMLANHCDGEVEWMEPFLMDVFAGCYLIQP